MRTAYFDCFAGASGDMILGALLDGGLSLEVLRQELRKLRLSHFEIDARKESRRGISGTRAIVAVDQNHHGHHHRRLRDIQEIIGESDLQEPVKLRSLEVFSRLAEAEARVHGIHIDGVHFHEVGAMDAIIDVVGAVAGLAALGIQKVCCSALHVGAGTVECAHGVLPVPAPATAELIRGKPAYSTGVQGELLTPTGAAILTTISSEFGPMPLMDVETIGYGAGTLERTIPNLLRVVIGEAGEMEATDVEGDVGGCDTDRVAVIETNIDDMNPQIYDHLMRRVLDAGGLDIFLTPAQMKKNRPGTLVTIVSPVHLVRHLAGLLLEETTSIGLRWRVEKRIKARRTVEEIPTELGRLRFKVARTGKRIVNVTPEYDDCKRIAVERGLSIKDVMEVARAAARERWGAVSSER